MAALFTIGEPTLQEEHRVRGSCFISRTLPVTDRTEVNKALHQARKAYSDATHICYAYRLATEGSEPEEFASDAGEPNGSAGMPMLNVLRQAELMDVLALVVRYFGGTKLGIPGLIAAYSESVRLTLEGSDRQPWVAQARMEITLPYPLADRVKGEVEKLGGEMMEATYGEKVALTVKVRRSSVQELAKRLRELGGGHLVIGSGAIDSQVEND